MTPDNIDPMPSMNPWPRFFPEVLASPLLSIFDAAELPISDAFVFASGFLLAIPEM